MIRDPGALSLRMRLTLIILLPLLGISLFIGAWALHDAQSRAGDRFDRSLLSAALAISRDVAVSGGDALTPETNAILRDTSGGLVFYHVYAPDGVFVTGYATPPVPPSTVFDSAEQQTYFDATYFGRPVRTLRFQDPMQIEGVVGDFTFTVWQDTRLRNAIVRDLSTRTFSIMASLVAALALIVWFGVRFGLSPLTDLQNAIARRSSAELAPIKRQVPHEVKGIVNTLNSLLGQVSDTMQAKDDFISNAAHQLRNPIAGVLVMSEAVQSAKSYDDMQERTVDLVAASRQASDLAQKLLAFERAKASSAGGGMTQADLVELVKEVCQSQVSNCIRAGVTLGCTTSLPRLDITCDVVMIAEAVTNLIDNALVHGGDDLLQIEISISVSGDYAVIHVKDDGRGFDLDDAEKALERFSQLAPTGGSGLGLAIAKAIAENHNGRLIFEPSEKGLSVQLQLRLVLR